jgi:signal transduction histidine kinase
MSSWHGTVPGAAWRVIARAGDLPCAVRLPGVILRDDPTIVCMTDDPGAHARYGGAVETWSRLVTRLRRMDPYRADLLLAGVLLAEMTIEVAFMPAAGHIRLAAWLVCLAEAAGVALRRRATLVGATLIAAGFLTLVSIVPENSDTLEVPWFLILIGVYSIGANLDGWRLHLGVVLSAVPAMIAVFVAPDGGGASSAVFAGLILITAPLLIGRVMRHRSRLNRALRTRTRQLEEERAARAEQAMLEERTRIAGELHDVVAHALSAMVVQASAARRLVPRDPERAQAAFASVEATGRDALTEIRSLLGVLRREDEDVALAPQPSLAHVSSLVKRTSAAGLQVALHMEGDARELPAGVDLTAYRVLQAALGGALEHGGAGRADVTVRYGAERVEIEVFDDGTGDGDARLLLGARERVALYGGDLQSGPVAAGGHSVRARLPVGAGA